MKGRLMADHVGQLSAGKVDNAKAMLLQIRATYIA